MSEEALLQLLQPLTYAIMGAGFCGIYYYSRELVAAKFWAFSYLFGSLGFLIDFSLSNGDSHLTSWATNFAYFAASSLYVTGHFVRMKQPVPVKALALLGAITIISMVMFRHIVPDTTLRTIAINVLNALVFMLPVAALIRHDNRLPDTPLVDRIAGLVLAFFVATFFIRVGLLASGMVDQNLTDENYTASVTAASFRIITTLCAMGSAVVLYVMLGIDMATSIQRRSQIDSMTTLLNKHTFEMQAKMLISPGRAVEGRGHSLVLCDIDHFKAINDSHGHAAGDVVIKWVGRILSKTVRQSDLAGRVGGEEFALLLRDCDETDAASIAEALRGVIADHMMDIGRQKVIVTASFGIAHAHPDENFTELFARADEQLYRAKKSGRNRVCVASNQPSYAPQQAAAVVRPVEFGTNMVARVA